MKPRRLYTAKEVAERFHVDARTPGRWHDSGKLRWAFKTPGGHGRWDADTVDALVAVKDFGDVLDGEPVGGAGQ